MHAGFDGWTAGVLYARLGRTWLRAAIVAGGATMLLVSASRMVLAEHWLVDVAAGIVRTAGVAMLAAALLRIGPATPARVGPCSWLTPS